MKLLLKLDRTACTATMVLALAGVLPADVAKADTVGYSGAQTTYSITTSGTYFILAGGAQGGSGALNPGGAGTEIEGSAYLPAGTVLDIAVGGQGLTGNFGTIWGGGGGGGTFIWLNGSPTPLLVAGGGGGAGYDGAGGIAATSYTTSGAAGSVQVAARAAPQDRVE